MGPGGWTGDVKHTGPEGEQLGHLWRGTPREREEGSRVVCGGRRQRRAWWGRGSRPRASRQWGRPGGSRRGRRCLPRPLPGRQRAGGSPVPRRRANPVLRSRLGLALTWAARARGAGAAGPERGGLFRGALSRSSSRGGGSSSRSGRLSLRLSVSHRGGVGGREGGARPPEEGPRRGRHWAPRARRRRGGGHAPEGGALGVGPGGVEPEDGKGPSIG